MSSRGKSDGYQHFTLEQSMCRYGINSVCVAVGPYIVFSVGIATGHGGATALG